jgi:hypothetical protein
MPTATRARTDRRKHKFRVWGYVSAAVMCIGAWLIPRSSGAIILGAVIVFACSIPAALSGYRYKARWYLFVPIMIGHAALLCLVSWIIWPKITVSPARMTYGQAYDAFSFQVKNQTSGDVDNVIPIMRIEGSSDLHDWQIRVDNPTTLKYFGMVNVPGIVCEDEVKGGYVLFPIIPQIDSGQESRFVVTYTGNSKPKLTVENPRHIRHQAISARGSS